MPSPLQLAAMETSLQEYLSYSNAKKARFQKAAQAKLAEIHETDMDAYIQLTKDAVTLANDASEKADDDAREDEEFS